MFSGIKTIIDVNKRQFTIHDLLFRPTNTHIIDICDPTKIIQCVVSKTKSYISFLTTNNTDSMFMTNVLCSFLSNNRYNLPSYQKLEEHIPLTAHIHYDVLSTSNYEYKKPFLYQSEKNTFQFDIQEELYEFILHVGGQTFMGCMDIYIHKHKDTHTLAKIKSEKECGYDRFLSSGETVDMVKSMLQLCQVLFDANKFIFTDNSEIDCLPKDMSKPPESRKIQEPMSLAHTSIINKCKTWYEYNFNAKLLEKKQQDKFEEGIYNLNKPITDSFEKFSKTYGLSYIQHEKLKPMFEKATSILDFLRTIPQNQHCVLLKKWISFYMTDTMKFNINRYEWVITLDNSINVKFSRKTYM